MAKKKYKIFLSADNNYFIHLYVSIASIFENCSDKGKLSFFILDGGISPKNKKSLITFVKKNNSSVKFIHIMRNKYSNAKLWGHVSEPGYYRFEIPSKERSSKVVYLDCDIVVKADLIELFNINLNGKTIGAVLDYNEGILNKKKEFNSGILVIDCDSWNKKNYTFQIFEYIKKNGQKISFADQEVFNKFFSNDWFSLPLGWNRQRSIFDLTAQDLNMSRSEYLNLLNKPNIIHYVGKIKPWDYEYVFPDKKDYLKIRTSLDNKFFYKERGVKKSLFKLLRFFIYKLKILRFFRRQIK